MRDIKFRAFWKENKVMEYDKHNHIDWEFMPKEPCENHDCILMQYTGLKDKNGKEIYEFDYVIDQFGQRILVEYEFSLLSRLKDIEKYLIIDGNLYE